MLRSLADEPDRTLEALQRALAPEQLERLKERKSDGDAGDADAYRMGDVADVPPELLGRLP